MRVLVTGADGFVGRKLCGVLIDHGFDIRAALQFDKNVHVLPKEVEKVFIGDISEVTDWQDVLKGIDVIVHLAARVHVMKEKEGADDIEAFRKVNVIATECLAREAVESGVKRFIFLSSIGVNGEVNFEKPFTENDTPNPISAYARSKWEAEKVLHKVVNETGLKVTILRPPLVYGFRAPGNFSRLVKIVRMGIPLPFKGVHNKRSFIFLDNLVDIIKVCAVHPNASGETFLVSDGQDVSTPDLIKTIALTMGKKSCLFFIPLGLLKTLFKLLGRQTQLEKLIGNLVVDNAKIKKFLDWKPPFTFDQGISEALREHE